MPADARSDVFSLGTVLYELLSGRRVFERESMLDTLNAVVRDEPPPLRVPGRGDREALPGQAGVASLSDDERCQGGAAAAAARSSPNRRAALRRSPCSRSPT